MLQETVRKCTKMLKPYVGDVVVLCAILTAVIVMVA